MTEKETKMLGCIVSLLLMFPLMALKAVVVRDLWLWFIVPLGLPALTFWHAFGLSITISYLTHQIVADPFEGEDHAWALRLFVTTFAAFTAWGIGYLVSAGV